MTRIPSGTITFLFTDIVGSTRLWQQYPQQMVVALREHDRILRQAIEGQDGYVFKTVGDAFYGAFQTATAALAAALAAQRGLAAAQWPEGMPALQARMGLHSGAADEREGDYFGPALNRVARLMSVAQGGQVLVSSAATYLLRDILPEGVFLRDLGQHRLKDLPEPETIFQLVAPELADQFAPLHTSLDRMVVLPVKATPFLGRERELEEAIALLSRPEVRLLTLTGVGGTGKTRLSLQMAAVLADSFADGVLFVDLSPVSDWTRVADTILAALDTPARGEEAPESALQSALREREMLLVLDNYEQVIPAAALVGSLLQAAPRLTIVVTSRERLNIYGEVTYAVPPLGLPEPGTAVSLESAAQSEAVTLFVSRAQAVNQSFVLDESNMSDVIELCRRLDGLPLAIELAAARSRLFAPAALLERLDRLLGTSSGGLRDLPQRQQTLRGAIGWSYDLLSADEQQLFRRLAVFHGGRSLEAAEAVCGRGLELEVWEGLESLFDKSLLVRAEGPFGEPRFVMLETIQEYAGAALESSGEAEALRERHAAFFYDLVARTAPGLRGAQSRQLMMILQPEQENIRAALSWCLDGGDVEQGAAMIAALSDFWLYSYGHGEAVQWLGRALALKARVSAPTRAAVLTAASKLALFRLKAEEGRTYGRDALAIAQEVGEKSAIAWAMIWLGASYYDLPASLDEGLHLAGEGVRLFKELELDVGISQGLNIEGEMLRYNGRLAEAEAAYKELVPIAQATGEVRREVMQYGNLAMIAYERRNETELVDYALTLLPLSLENAIEDTAVLALELIAVVLHWHDRHELAATLVGAAQAWYERTATVAQAGDALIERRIIAEVRSGLDEEAYQRAQQAGSRLTLQDAADIAFAEVRRLREEGATPAP